MKKTLILGLLIAAMLIAGCYGTQTAPETKPATTTQTVTTGEVKEFEITAKQWEFVPNIITVNQGDTVKLTVTSADVTHGFNLPDFGVNERLNPGKPVKIEFVADKKGTFPFACNIPCGRGHGGMNGRLIVK